MDTNIKTEDLSNQITSTSYQPSTAVYFFNEFTMDSTRDRVFPQRNLPTLRQVQAPYHLFTTVVILPVRQ